jgi:cell volume regulation protein A
VAPALTLVHRSGEIFVPDRHTSLRTGDHLLLAVSDHAREATEARLRAISQGGRLAVWRDDVVHPGGPRPRAPATPGGSGRAARSGV